MIDQFKRLGRHTLIYGIGEVTGSLLSILLLPLYTRYLTTYDYGVISLLAIFTMVLGCVYDFGITNAVGRYYYVSEDINVRRQYISSALTFSISLPLIISLIVCLFSKHISIVLFNDSKLCFVVIICVAGLYFRNLQAVPSSVIRLREKSKFYMIISLTRILLSIAIKIYLVVVLKYGVLGYFTSDLVTSIILLPALFACEKEYMKIGLDIKKLKEMVRYGAPFIPALAAFWIIDSSDRYFVKGYLGLEKAGIYSMGYSLAMGILLLVNAFGNAWPPFYMSNYKREDSELLFKRVLNYYLSGIMFAVLGISLFSKELLALLTTKSFGDAGVIIPFVALSYAMKGIYLIVLIGLYIRLKTIYQFYIEGVSALINILLNIILIPSIGLLGAGIATLASYISLPLITAFVCQRFYPRKYDAKKIVLILFVTIFLGCGWFISSGKMIVDILLKSLMLFSYPILLWKLGIIENKEKTILYGFVRNIISKNKRRILKN